MSEKCVRTTTTHIKGTIHELLPLMLLQQQNSCGIVLGPLELIQANASENAGPLEVVLPRIPGRGDEHAGVATPECLSH
jgi:hypothetical protein